MEKQIMLLSLSYFLLKDVILHPTSAFEKIKQNGFQRATLIIFGFGALLPFCKSFIAKRQIISFFANERMNQIFSIMSIPQLRWFIIYMAYFGFLYGIFSMCRFFNQKANIKSLLLTFMSISVVGIVGQIFFYPLLFILPKNLVFLGNYMLYLWSGVLSIQAIRITQGLSLPKAIISFFVPAIIIVAIMGLTAIAPYLTWLNLK